MVRVAHPGSNGRVIRECVRCIGTRKETGKLVIASIQTQQAGFGGRFEWEARERLSRDS